MTSTLLAGIILAAAQDPDLAGAVNDWLTARAAGDAQAMERAERTLASGAPELRQTPDWSALLESARAAWTDPFPLGAWTDLRVRGQPCRLRVPGYGNQAPFPLVVVIALPALAANPPAELEEHAAWMLVDLHDLEPDSWRGQAGRFRVLAPLSELFASLRLDRNRVALVGIGAGAELARELALRRPHDFSSLVLVGRTAASVPSFETTSLSVQEAPDLAAAAAAALSGPPRQPYPLRFRHRPADPEAGRAFWVQAQRFDYAGAPLLDVAVDGGSHTVLLRGEDIEQVDLLLNDVLLDLDPPLTIVRNGVSYRFQAQRSLRTLLESFYRNRDPEAIFTVLVRGIDLPPRPR